MNLPTLKNWLSVAASAFAAGAWGYVQSHSGEPMKPALVGAAIAGIVALVHLYTTVPGGDK